MPFPLSLTELWSKGPKQQQKPIAGGEYGPVDGSSTSLLARPGGSTTGYACFLVQGVGRPSERLLKDSEAYVLARSGGHGYFLTIVGRRPSDVKYDRSLDMGQRYLQRSLKDRGLARCLAPKLEPTKVSSLATKCSAARCQNGARKLYSIASLFLNAADCLVREGSSPSSWALCIRMEVEAVEHGVLRPSFASRAADILFEEAFRR